MIDIFRVCMENLPSELINAILGHLSIKDAGSISSCCTLFNELNRRRIDKVKDQLPWRIAMEYSHDGTWYHYSTRVKIGWFPESSPTIYEEDWDLKGSSLVVLKGVGGEMASDILREYPTLKVKIEKGTTTGPIPIGVLPLKDSLGIGCHSGKARCCRRARRWRNPRNAHSWRKRWGWPTRRS